MKKLLTAVAAAAMLLVSVGASAIHDSRANVWHNGYYVSLYKLYNDRPYAIRCRVVATNGADYIATIPPYTWSRTMRINDASADIRWHCNRL